MLLHCTSMMVTFYHTHPPFFMILPSLHRRGHMNFEDFIIKERERLTTERTALTEQQQALTEKLKGIQREMLAIDAYEAARKGKATTSRAPRGSHRETVLSLLTASPGLQPKEIKARLGDNTPKGLHNLLATLKKQKKVKETDGKYTAV
jgi:hypothetical protein